MNFNFIPIVYLNLKINYGVLIIFINKNISTIPHTIGHEKITLCSVLNLESVMKPKLLHHLSFSKWGTTCAVRFVAFEKS